MQHVKVCKSGLIISTSHVKLRVSFLSSLTSVVEFLTDEGKSSLLKLVAAAASEPEANERGSSLISRRLHYRGLQSLFLTKRKELWLARMGRFRMHSGMPQGIVAMREWEDLGCAVTWHKDL